MEGGTVVTASVVRLELCVGFVAVYSVKTKPFTSSSWCRRYRFV